MPKKLKACAIPAIIFLLLIVAVQSVSASDWIEIFEDIDGWVYSIDRDSIQTKSYSSIVTAWTRTMYPDKSHKLTLYAYDFSDRTYRIITFYRYDSSNRMTDSDTTSSGWEHIIPDTVGEGIYLYLKDYLNR